VTAGPATVDELTAEEAAVRDLCREVAAGEIAPHAARWWEEQRCPTELFRKLGELDLMGLLVPPEEGGAGLSTVGTVAALYEVAKVDQSVAAGWQAHLTIGSLPLLLFGTPEQRERWLRPLAAGELLGSFGLTEPDAGSDAAGIRTLAVRDEDGWTLNGSKTFISNAGTDMSLGPVVLARTSRDDRRFGAFLVERGTPGFHLGEKIKCVGWHSLDSRELRFDDVRLTDEHLIGNPERGLSQFLSALAVGRITVATLGIALADAVLRLSLDYARQRKQFGQPIAKFQAIQFKLADIASRLEAVRLLVFHAARLRDAGRPFAKEAAMAKLMASELAVDAASEAVQIHGGYGWTHEYPVSRFFADSKILEIGEGTSEIQRLVIARHLGC
jgi:alkylation response protein AidB-like acyl-CoA dehydrogenase